MLMAAFLSRTPLQSTATAMVHPRVHGPAMADTEADWLSSVVMKTRGTHGGGRGLAPEGSWTAGEGWTELVRGQGHARLPTMGQGRAALASAGLTSVNANPPRPIQGPRGCRASARAELGVPGKTDRATKDWWSCG